MSKNTYDDEIFFQKYSEMLRSRKGLAGAGEWPALRQLLGPAAGEGDQKSYVQLFSCHIDLLLILCRRNRKAQ